MFITLLLFILSFCLLWVGSGLAVSAVTKIARSLRMSSFFVSFFVLGFFTSITEIMVGINAVIDNTPEIFMGNLIGSSVVIFMLVIPLLAVLGNGVSLNHNFKFKDLVTAALVVGFPAVLTIDSRFSIIDTVLCIVMYGYFVYTQEKNSSSMSKIMWIHFKRSTIYMSFLKILAAIVLVFTASNILVQQTTQLATFLGVSPFLISILVISIGTNIPELSIALRAILARKKDVAFGNYLGSATLNTFEIGLLSLVSKKPIVADGSNYSILAFLFGMAMFVYFGKSRNNISRLEGSVLLGLYLLFFVFEMSSGPGWNFSI